MGIASKRGGVDSFYFEDNYPFPGIFGADANNIIKTWIKRYIAILFLRQYTLHDYFVYSHTTEMPAPPEKFSEKKLWTEELKVLKTFVSEYLSDKECLRELNMEKLSSPDWFASNNKPNPEELIDTLINEIKTSAEKKKNKQPLFSNKIEQFKTSTREILIDCFDNYKKLFTNNIANTTPHKSLMFKGIYTPIEKTAFTEDQDMSYVDFDSIYTKTISIDFKNNLPSIFNACYKTTLYHFPLKDIPTAIDNLRLNSMQFTIVTVGVNLNPHKLEGSTYKENVLEEYNGIPVIDFGYSQFEAVNKSIFIMRNEDLPCIVHNEVNEQVVNKYRLVKIDEKYNIYAIVINLHEDSVLKSELKKRLTIQDLDKYVLACVDMNTEVRCRENAKCIQIKAFSQFNNTGKPNSLLDIKNIWS